MRNINKIFTYLPVEFHKHMVICSVKDTKAWLIAIMFPLEILQDFLFKLV